MKLNMLNPSPPSLRRKHLSKQRRNVIMTRLLLCVAVSGFTFFSSHVVNKWPIYFSAIAYGALHLSLIWVKADVLRLKRLRFFRALTDVVLISVVIYYTNKHDSSWYIFYSLPIITVSRYAGTRGSLILAAVAASIYSWIYFYGTPPGTDLTVFLLRVALLLTIAFASKDFWKVRDFDELEPIAFFKEIDRLLRKQPLQAAYELILQRGLELTNSNLGSIWLTGPTKRVVARGIPDEESPLHRIDEALCDRPIKTKQSEVTPLTPHRLERVLKEKYEIPEGAPKEALTTPILIDDRVRGAIAVYSNRRYHYTKREQARLESLTTAIGIVLNHVESLQSSRAELETVKLISAQLNRYPKLEELFNHAVESVLKHCKAEEAALFLAEPSIEGKSEAVLIKVACKLADADGKILTADSDKDRFERMSAAEDQYREGDGYVGKVFAFRRSESFSVPPGEVLRNDRYGSQLPSGSTKSRIAVPLLFGDERLGVLRAINHRDPVQPNVNPEKGVAATRFSADDLTLLEIISSQIAAAIHNSRLLERYETLVTNSPDPIIVLDPHSRIKEFNKACEEIWAYTAAETIGDRVEKYYKDPEHAKAIGEALKNAEKKRLRNYEAIIKHREGWEIPISLSASLLHDKEGRFEGSIGVFKDLRPMKLLEDKVRIAQNLAMVGRVARIVGHEIKNQMNIVLGYVSRTKLEQWQEEDRQDLHKAYSEIRNAALSSIETLNSTLLAAQARPLQERLVILEDLFEKIIERMEARAKDANVQFDVSFPREEAEMLIDVEQMQLVLWNLYNNSLQAIESRRQIEPALEGRISVTTEVNSGHVHLLWQDNGTGIPASLLPHIFDAFFTMKETGTGLGLFLSRNVVESHKGSLTVTSKLNPGACFEMTLPIYQGDTNEEEDLSDPQT